MRYIEFLQTIPHDYLKTYGDKTRWYTPISKDEVIRFVKEERLEIY